MCAPCMPRAAVPIVESFAASHRREVTRYICPMRRGEGALRTRRNKTTRGHAKRRRARRRREAEKPRGAESGFTQCGRTRHCRAGGLSVLYTRERSSPSRRTRHRSASAPKRRATARDVLASLHNPHSLDTPLPLRVIGEPSPLRALCQLRRRISSRAACGSGSARRRARSRGAGCYSFSLASSLTYRDLMHHMTAPHQYNPMRP